MSSNHMYCTSNSLVDCSSVGSPRSAAGHCYVVFESGMDVLRLLKHCVLRQAEVSSPALLNASQSRSALLSTTMATTTTHSVLQTDVPASTMAASPVDASCSGPDAGSMASNWCAPNLWSCVSGPTPGTSTSDVFISTAPSCELLGSTVRATSGLMTTADEFVHLENEYYFRLEYYAPEAGSAERTGSRAAAITQPPG